MRLRSRQSGFSLVEFMMVMVIFAVVIGAVFGLLNAAQFRYRAELEFLESLQGARLGLELLTLDIHNAGYPPRNAYDSASPSWGAGGVPVTRIAIPFVGMVGGVVNQTCTVNGGGNPCTIPGPFELAIETDIEPDGTTDWIYYRLDTPGNAVAHPPTGGGQARILYRAVSPKTVGGNPTAVAGTPVVDNVLQDPGAAVSAANPALFTYVCAGGVNPCTPENIQEVRIVLQARAARRDLQTQQIRALTLQSAARRLNPPQ